VSYGPESLGLSPRLPCVVRVLPVVLQCRQACRFRYCSGCPCNSPLPSPVLRQPAALHPDRSNPGVSWETAADSTGLRSKVRHTTVRVAPTTVHWRRRRNYKVRRLLSVRGGLNLYLLRFLQNCIVMNCHAAVNSGYSFFQQPANACCSQSLQHPAGSHC